jgi:long-chain acyl-CoA synthetase
MSIVTAYDTLGEEGLRHSLEVTESKAIFLEPHLLGLLNKVVRSAPSIEYVIYNTDSMESLQDEDVRALQSSSSHIKLLSFEELRTLGESNPVDPIPPKPEDVCAIMFTSGSGSTPKGVELTHRNIVAAGRFVAVIAPDSS